MIHIRLNLPRHFRRPQDPFGVRVEPSVLQNGNPGHGGERAGDGPVCGEYDQENGEKSFSARLLCGIPSELVQ